MASLSRTSVAIFALGFIGAIAACGHSPLDLIPEPAQDAGGRFDAGVGVAPGDSGAPDAGCTPPSCPGTYVSNDAGNDTNPGTGAAPVKTIHRAIEIAVALGGPQDVYVAGSDYTEKITLFEGVSLRGGYECSGLPCSWARAIRKNDTAILNKDFVGVLAPSTITRKTVLEGFRIEGKQGAPNAALTIEGGSPTIARCRINGADASGGRSIGVLLRAPSNDPNGALLVENEIGAGKAAEASIGILLEAPPSPTPTSGVAVATIKKNRIRGGDATMAAGVAASASGRGTRLEDNDIFAGTSTGGGAWGIVVASEMTIDRNRINVDQDLAGTCQSTTDPNWCGGIRSDSSTTTITNNIVFGVRGPRSCAVFLLESEKAAGAVVLNSNTLDGAGAGPTDGRVSAAVVLRTTFGSTGHNAVIGKMRNNIFLGGLNKNRYGIFEETEPKKTARPAALDNNDCYNPPISGSTTDVEYRSWDGAKETNVACESVGSGNINSNPGFGAAYHLQQGSPLINQGIATEAPRWDMDGEVRPQGKAFDIGADEAP